MDQLNSAIGKVNQLCVKSEDQGMLLGKWICTCIASALLLQVNHCSFLCTFIPIDRKRVSLLLPLLDLMHENIHSGLKMHVGQNYADKL